MRRLQEFGFEKSAYERPNQKWVCGHAKEGRCCFAGPDAQGNCTATAECRPLRKGDRWYCTRPPFLGGPCADGPLPDGQCCRPIPKCSPVRSLRYTRGITVLVTVALTTSILALCLGLKQGKRVFSPGELSFAHGSSGNDCTQCHGAMGAAAAGWLAGATNAAHDNSQLCLNCHTVGQDPLQPHSLPPDRLAPLTAAVKKHSATAPPAGLVLASFVPGLDRPGADGIACADCHKEHRGREADIKKISDSQCQACHASQFVSFAQGHPQFSHYPFYRRTRIIFDHESHLHGHFSDPAVEKFRPVSCLDCHEPDPRGGAMLVKSFETVCASCHDNEIKGKSAVNPGLPFISLPRMDDQTLSGDFAIGEWPEDADQPLTPFLRFLLAGDPSLRAALDKLQGVDLSSLPKSDPAKIKAAQTLAWGIKALIFDLGIRGQDELIRRVNLSLGRHLSDYETEGIVAFLPAVSVRSAFQSAFPHLQKEILDHRNNAKPPPTQLVPSPDLASPGPVKVAAPDVMVSQGGWYSPDGSFTLFYRPRGHADRFLSSWMNMTVDAEATGDPAEARAVAKYLSSPATPGLCSKCHSIDDTPVKQVNWTARPDSLEHGFNRFSHAAHLSLLDMTGCLKCHPMTGPSADPKSSYASAFDPGQHNPSIFHSNFRMIDKSVCASCHRPNAVQQDCLLCHDYHIGRFKPMVPRANFASVSQLGAPR